MLVVIAEKEEYELVEELGYNKLPVLVTGVGAANVIKALRDIPKTEKIINIGYAGSNTYEVGTKTLIANVYTDTKPGLIKDEPELLCKIPEGEVLRADVVTTCYTSTDFVKETNRTAPCVFDMELAYIRAMFDNVIAIKVVSDKLSYKEYKKTTKGE